jgi:multicomponent K+:H+ antiporter subunit E
MRRLLPFPLASAGLLIIWLVLNQTLTPGHILLGILAALIGGFVLTVLQAPRFHVRRLSAVVRLSALVIADIIRSNIAVARIILGFATRQRTTSGFVDIPLDLHNPYALAALACIITATPGTLWAHFDSRTGTLTIHVLDLIDEADWSRTVKGRYERLLLEIFP